MRNHLRVVDDSFIKDYADKSWLANDDLAFWKEFFNTIRIVVGFFVMWFVFTSFFLGLFL